MAISASGRGGGSIWWPGRLASTGQSLLKLIPKLRLDATCVDYLQAYRWPGNVRELENAIERAAVLCKDGVILPEFLPPSVLPGVSTPIEAGDPLQRSLAQVEREHIQAVLKAAGGNRSRAAKILGLSLTTLWRKLKEQEKAREVTS